MNFNRTVSIVNAHAEGEVGNVIVGGVVDVPGHSAFEKMEYLRDQLDSLRRSILFEPRGSVCHAVNVLLPTSNPAADLAFVIMEATKYPAMSGSNAICVATVILETGIRPMREPETTLMLEAPGGLVEARCACKNGKVLEVRLTMLPSFVHARLAAVEVPGYGAVDIAIAYGGIFHAIVDAASLGLQLRAQSAADLVAAGVAIRRAVNDAFEAVHPENGKIRGIPNVVLAGAMEMDSAGSVSIRSTPSATVIGNGRLDRSPTGTGVAARTALLVEDGLVRIGEEVIHRSIFSTSFRSKPVRTTTAGPHAAVVSELAGQAWITGFTQMLIDPSDPLAEGHCPNDVWFTKG